ncbi:hypothetical protein AAE478_006963 [Parahypoxylon ruwenzoriense]
MGFSAEAANELRSIMEKSVTASGDNAATRIPGTTFVVVDRNGTELFAHSAGKRGISTTRDAGPMTLDSVYWIASCTKMVTGLACMQLVEKGVLSLDDAGQVEALCPGLRDVKVLRDDGTFEDKKRGITLRMLLAHTSGFGYSFFDETLRDWSHPAGINEFSGDVREIYKMPLRFQPGEGWKYGVGIDWAGIVLERKTGTRLNDYIQENICKPLGLENVNMIPTQAMKEKLAYMNSREKDGNFIPRDHVYRRPLIVETPEEIAATFHSGGGGLFAKPQEYARILSVLLNNGTCPRTGAVLVSKATVDTMFTNQIPQFPEHGRQGIPAAKPDQTNPIPDLYPIPSRPPQGWGLTFMITGPGATTGRSDTTGYWAGLPNLFWWCDREKGVAGIVCSQILPFADAGVFGMWFELEAAVYRHLKAA